MAPRVGGSCSPSSRVQGSGAPARRPPQGSYRVEENVVKAGGHGVRLPPEGAAPPVLQPVPSRKSKQHQQHEEEEGAANHRWHRRGHCGVSCGRRARDPGSEPSPSAPRLGTAVPTALRTSVPPAKGGAPVVPTQGSQLRPGPGGQAAASCGAGGVVAPGEGPTPPLSQNRSKRSSTRLAVVSGLTASGSTECRGNRGREPPKLVEAQTRGRAYPGWV